MYHKIKNMNFEYHRFVLIFLIVSFLGFFVNMVNPENFDNEARSKEVGSGQNPPKIIIIHGEKDVVIPRFMGRKLSKLFPEITTYHEISGMGHSGIFRKHKKIIYKYIYGEDNPPLTLATKLNRRN